MFRKAQSYGHKDWSRSRSKKVKQYDFVNTMLKVLTIFYYLSLNLVVINMEQLSFQGSSRKLE